MQLALTYRAIGHRAVKADALRSLSIRGQRQMVQVGHDISELVGAS